MSQPSEYVYKGQKISVRVMEHILPSGTRHAYEIVEYIGSVAILPLLDKDTVVLLKQYRPAISKWIYEVPAGTLQVHEDPHECASRELEEETGYKARLYPATFDMYIAPGYSTEKMRLFIATNLILGNSHPNESEEIKVEKLSVKKVLHMINTNVIRDAKTIALVLYYMWFIRAHLETNDLT